MNKITKLRLTQGLAVLFCASLISAILSIVLKAALAWSITLGIITLILGGIVCYLTWIMGKGRYGK